VRSGSSFPSSRGRTTRVWFTPFLSMISTEHQSQKFPTAKRTAFIKRFSKSNVSKSVKESSAKGCGRDVEDWIESIVPFYHVSPPSSSETGKSGPRQGVNIAIRMRRSTRMKIAVFVGSLRKESYNLKTAKEVLRLAPKALEMEILEIGDLPL